MKIGKLIVLIFLLSGCAANYQVARENAPGANTHILAQNPLGVMLAQENGAPLGSGLIVSTKIKSALIGRFESVGLIETVFLKKAIQVCMDQGIAYLIVPVIRQWDDRNNPWTLEPDKLELRISVVKVSNGTEILVFTYRAEDHSGEWTDYPVERMLGRQFQSALLREMLN